MSLVLGMWKYILDLSPNSGAFNSPVKINFFSYESEVKHVKVERKDGEGYFLDTGRYFPSLVELVAFYQCNSLKESFTTLDTTLKFPITTLIVGYAIALHNFQATAPNMIALRRDDFVIIVNKKDSERGWWKGKVDDKVRS